MSQARLQVLPKILIIDHELDHIESVKGILETQGYEVITAVTGQGGLAKAQIERPDLVLLEIDLPDIDGYEVCRALRSTPSTARIPIIIHSSRADVADKVAGFKAGANDYVVKPAAAAELVARIEATLGATERPLTHIVALWGCKGGVGTTTVASNLAVALRSRTGQRVTLLDASVLGGTLDVMLNLPPQYTMADLIPHLDSLDTELLTSVLAKHSSGVNVLLSSPWSNNGSKPHPDQWERILGWLQDISDYVIIDTAPSLDESTIAVLELADQVVILLTPEMTSLRNARLFLNLTTTWAQGPQKFLLVLNRYPVKGCIKLKDIEKALQRQIDMQIPSDEALVTYSINRGVPLVVSHPRSPIARSLYRLAEMIIAQKEEKESLLQSSSISA